MRDAAQCTLHKPFTLKDTPLLCTVKYFAHSAVTLLRGSSFLPGTPAPGHRSDVRIPHLLQILRRQRRTKSPAAVQDQLGVLVRGALLDVALDYTFPDVLGSARVSRGPFALFTNIDEPGLTAVGHPTRFIDADLAHPCFRILDQLEESGRMFHTPAGARLPVSCLRPTCALRRATSSAVATAAADSAVHPTALDQLSPRLKLGGSSSFQARHPLSSPRSINRPATIAAPAPTSNQ